MNLWSTMSRGLYLKMRKLIQHACNRFNFNFNSLEFEIAVGCETHTRQLVQGTLS